MALSPIIYYAAILLITMAIWRWWSLKNKDSPTLKSLFIYMVGSLLATVLLFFLARTFTSGDIALIVFIFSLPLFLIYFFCKSRRLLMGLPISYLISLLYSHLIEENVIEVSPPIITSRHLIHGSVLDENQLWVLTFLIINVLFIGVIASIKLFKKAKK